MPISDAGYPLRVSGDGLLDGVEALTGVDIGPCPLSGMLVRIYLPLDGTSLTCNVAECATLGGSYVDIEEGPWSFPVGATTYIRRVFWTERFIKWEVTECTGSYGNATVGLVHGAEPN